jgi:hypothetical protein
VKKLSIVAALLALAIAVPLGIGSSHREAPLTSLDPAADDTDVYAFTAKNDPATTRNEEDRLTVVANWIPFEDPAGGPNFYRFDDRAHYYINIDNDGDGKANVRYRFEFKTKVEDPNSFLYAKPPVNSLGDTNLNVKQTYDIYREGRVGARDSRKGGARKHSRRGQKSRGDRKHRRARTHARGRKNNRRGRHRKGRRSSNRSIRLVNDYPVAPNNVGPRTMPNYNALASEAIRDVNFPGDVGKVFVGQREDPFFVDLGATFDGLNIRSGAGGGKDDLAGYSVHSIVLQIPEEDITRDREEVEGDDDGDEDNREEVENAQADPDAVVGVWASTERRKLQVTDSNEPGKGDFVQVSRLANPLVNEVVIPLGQKDKFNRTTPDRDAQYADFVLKPELARLLNAIFGFNPPVKETDRTDIVLALLQGIPGLNRQTGKPVDTIKVNLGTPPSSNPGAGNRLGVLGGDNAGFPNGRRLEDDVVDIELRVVGGALIGNSLPLGDGVDRNDKPFSATFPYLAAPTSGYDARLKCGDGLEPCPTP